jgi:hypothetical protein
MIVSPGYPNQLCHNSHDMSFDKVQTAALALSPSALYSAAET